jgi:type IV pilus assembly protein PilV
MNKFSKQSVHKKTQNGMTFLEVLIALVIMVTGILGAVAMQATAKQASFDAMQRSLASSLAQDIISRMRANDVLVLDDYKGIKYGTGDFVASVPNRCDQVNVNCSSALMLANDKYEWELAIMGGDVTAGAGTDKKNVGGLVGGQGCIIVNGNSVSVVVSWQGRTKIKDSKKSDTCVNSNGKDKRRQVVVEAFIV